MSKTQRKSSVLSRIFVLLLLGLSLTALGFASFKFATAEIGSSNGEKYAIIVGVSDYLYSNIIYLPDLPYCDDDAIALYEKLAPTWGATNVNLLVNSDANKTSIQDAIVNWLDPIEDSEDTVFFFFSGHGGNMTDVAPIDEADGKDEFICPHDFQASTFSHDMVDEIRDDELEEWLSNLEAGRIVVVLDTCHSGGFIESMGIGEIATSKSAETEIKPQTSDFNDGFAKDISASGRVILTSCAETEEAWTVGELQHGVFSYYVAEAISNLETTDTDTNGEVSAEEIFGYAEPRTVSYTTESCDTIQHPQIYDGYDGDLTLIEAVAITLDENPRAASLMVDGATYDRLSLPHTFIWAVNTDHTFNAISLGFEVNEESLHPYSTYCNTTWNITRPAATEMSVHFNYINTENNYDYVQILDSTGNNYASYTGNYTDMWSVWAPGDTIRIRLTSDFSICYDGFVVDGLRYVDNAEHITQEYTRYTFSSWSDGNMSTSRAITATERRTYTASYNAECYLTINSVYASKMSEGWYGQGTTAYASLTVGSVDQGNGTRRMFTTWSGDAIGANSSVSNPILMDSAKIAVANWKTQYQLSVTSLYGDVEGSGWYDENTNAYASVTSTTVPATAGVQYVFTSWSNAASGTTSTSNPILMDSPKSATANWKTQYKVSFAVAAGGGGTITPTNDTWVDDGGTPMAISASANLGYQFLSWSATPGIDMANTQSNTTTATVTVPGTITATFTPNVIPEFTTPLVLIILMIAVTLSAILFKPFKKCIRFASIERNSNA